MSLKMPRIKLPLPRRFCKDNSGAVIVEMTMVLIPFILLFLFIAELCTILYVSVSIDLAMAEAMRFTTASENPSVGTYRTIFTGKMEERIKQLPMMIFKEDKISFTTTYCNKEQVANNTCTASSPAPGTPLALYTIDYSYEPIFFPIPNVIINSGSMSRKGIYVMETQRIRQQSDEPETP